MPLQFNRVSLESNGRLVAEAKEVVNNDLVKCVERFHFEGSHMHAPTVYVNGVARTPGEMRRIAAEVNSFSMRCGGGQVY